MSNFPCKNYQWTWKCANDFTAFNNAKKLQPPDGFTYIVVDYKNEWKLSNRASWPSMCFVLREERSRCNPLCYNSWGHLGLYKIIPKLQPFILRCPSSSSSSWRAKIWANGRCCPWHFCPFGIWEILRTETLPNCTVLGYQNKLIRRLTNDI